MGLLAELNSAHKAFSVCYHCDGLVRRGQVSRAVCGLIIRRSVVLQASGPGVFLKMIFGTKWIFWRAAVVRQGQEQARAGRCDWRARAGVPGAKLRATGEEEGCLPLVGGP
jgi:hypothetical protein